jgi:acyl-[acyl-carrier-protein]-phospholipid O-acyltransferase/long-chain-fatty-acid--[acyl-carrier-protein] ligase
VAVTAVPDPHKGQRIIVVPTPLAKSIEEIRDALSTAGLPNIWIPAADSFLEVEQIPMLGTGKLDLKGLQQLALAHYGARELQHA